MSRVKYKCNACKGDPCVLKVSEDSREPIGCPYDCVTKTPVWIKKEA